MRARDERTVLTQRDADRRLGERLHDVTFWRSELQVIQSKVFIFTRYVFIHFVCTFCIYILGNKIDLELPSGLAWRKFVKSHHTTFDTKLALDL